MLVLEISNRKQNLEQEIQHLFTLVQYRSKIGIQTGEFGIGPDKNQVLRSFL
jgi:hypothetical protein